MLKSPTTISLPNEPATFIIRNPKTKSIILPLNIARDIERRENLKYNNPERYSNQVDTSNFHAIFTNIFSS